MAETPERWMGASEVVRIWHVRRDYLGKVARLCEVPVRSHVGESRGTYGSAPGWSTYRAEDMRRAAPDIVEGRIDIPPLWRTDTREGRRAQFWEDLRLTLTCLVPVAFILFCFVMAIVSAIWH
ncbi:hypothetical protein [Kitasatospora sp. NPDC059827]|uniref:hypothetical protein n=1 Tax=Kitasatospora sp. NPDC059827 TaxID=3346964 RepID=UPI00364D9555